MKGKGREEGRKEGREGGREGTYQALASGEDDVLVVSLIGKLSDLRGGKPIHVEEQILI